jgi:hypothetical protein
MASSNAKNIGDAILIPNARYFVKAVSRGSYCLVIAGFGCPRTRCCCVTAGTLVVQKSDTYASREDELLTTLTFLLTNAVGAKAVADARKKAEAIAVNFILVTSFWEKWILKC